MADRVAVSGAAAGTGGASYRRILTFTGKTTGNYVLNEANFTGLGQYLPCLAVVAVEAVGTAATLAISHDNGTTFNNMVTGTTGWGQTVYLDTASTFRLALGAATNVRIFVQ